MNFNYGVILLSSVLFCLINSNQCNTVILICHGRGEDIANGQTNDFVQKVKQKLDDDKLNGNYTIVTVGLSNNSTEDNNWSSFKDMSFQSEKLYEYIRNDSIWKQLTNASRIVLVGCSQGALLLRGLLWDNCFDPLLPKIDKLITFGGPHSGVFGIPDCDQLNSNNMLFNTICQVFLYLIYDDVIGPLIGPGIFDSFIYSTKYELSFGDYWNDPVDPAQKLTWLAKINNQQFWYNKGKYLSDKLPGGLVCISFGDDDTVLPQISSAFGFWDGKAQNPISYNQTKLYLEDWIGLKILGDKGLIFFDTIPGQSHMNIPSNYIDKFFYYVDL